MTEEATSQTERIQSGSTLMSLIYGLVIFVSAYLLFQVQPLTSKSILPWFGGTPSVWTTCMLFFQLLLFAGYLYAHLLSSHLKPKSQLVTHVVLMALALTASVLPDAGWKPTGAENPTLQIVLMLSVSIGLPFFVLSSNGPLVQNWFSRAQKGRSPYHLYALSNVGSLLGLLLYPFFIEIQFDLPQQGSMWKLGFVVFVVGCAACGWNFSGKSKADEVEKARTDTPRPTFGRRLLWFMLAAVPSIMLLATTNQVCLDVASIPFLWILPLTLYLLTFILSFAGERWYLRKTCLTLLPISLVALVGIMIADADASIEFQVIAYMLALFLSAMTCHGELVRVKPEPEHLTTFYLWMSAGGAAGGLFVGLISPYIFDLYLELHVAILLTLLLMAVVLAEGSTWKTFWMTPALLFMSLAISVAMLLALEVEQKMELAVHTMRNFYGVLRATEEGAGADWTRRELLNGRILHGTQWANDGKRRWPTTYYGYYSGVGLALLSDAPEEKRHIGVVGLGTGSVAAYGDDNDRVTYYEINEDCLKLSAAGATILSGTGEEIPNPAIEPPFFTYLFDFPGDARVILGDARLALERAEDQKFDLLALDAFSSDAIPAHLLTKEAVQVYLRHMKPDGILAIHISNRHFDLRPVIAALGTEFKLMDRYVADERTDHPGEEDDPGVVGSTISEWVLLAKSEAAFASGYLADLDQMDEDREVLWTDDYSSLSQIMRSKDADDYKSDWDRLLKEVFPGFFSDEDSDENFDEGEEE